MLTTTYELDIVPGGVPQVITASQYDANSRNLAFNLYSSTGRLSLPSGTQAAIRGTKPDGNGFDYDATIAGTTVTFTITDQMTAIAGRVMCEVYLYSGTAGTSSYKQIATANFILYVKRAAMDKDTLISGSEIRQLVDIMDNSAEIIAAASLAATSAANAAQSAADAAQDSAAASSSATAASTSAGQAAVSAADAADVLAAATTVIHNERDAAISAVDTSKAAAIEEAETVYEQQIESLLAVKSNADEMAAAAIQSAHVANTLSAQALAAAGNAENDIADVLATVDQQQDRINAQQLQIDGKVDGGYVEDGVAYFTAGNQVLFEITGIGGGGSGGGSGNNAVITMTNTSGWMSKTVAQGDTCPVSFNWTSLEDQVPTGNGSLRIQVSGITKATLEVAQGDITVDVASYLSAGANTVSLTVSDIYGNNRTIRMTVTVVVLTLTSSFDTSTPYTGAISFPYTPTGSVQKTVHFILDGTEIGTQVTSVSGRQQSYTIAQQSHGAHTLRVYFEAEINGQTVRSNELYYEIICLEPMVTTPIVTSSFNETTAIQYATLNIPYTVYTPNALTSDVTIKVNGTTVSSVTVDRTEHSFSHRVDEVGSLTVAIISGTTTKTITLTVTESDIHVEAETQNLALHLTSAGRSNNEAHPEVWVDSDNNISATMSGFNFTSDGWVQDSDGVTACRVSGDARVTIPYQIFGTDFRSTGKTIEIEFATRNVMNYDSVILSCLSDGRGLYVTAQKATLVSEQSEISMQYKEDEHVRIGFVIEKRSENRLLFVYVNGIMSGVIQYPTTDDFAQTSPVNISIGSNDCTMDIYHIRVYDNNLTRHQMLDNWIADTQSVDDMIERYNRNNVYDAYGNIVIEKLPSSLPYIIISNCPELPQYKGDKKTCDISYVDPVTPSRSFTATNVQIDVQGTSSQYYYRKNYKCKFKNGFVMKNGSTVSKYALRTESIPVNTFCFKADVASSEGANNVELAIAYNDACPYKTPAQVANSAVRQGIDGFPIVIFYNDGTTTSFLGKYNFNNDKSTEETFGFAAGDESWEIKNNTGNRVIWKTADYTGNDWLNDFEARYPDTDPAYTDPAQLAEFAAWLVSTDPEQATDEPLSEPVTYVDGETSTTYTDDTAAYRLAKFRAELGNYVETDSALFFYLFTELFLMIDNRAKNVFPSFMGTTINS